MKKQTFFAITAIFTFTLLAVWIHADPPPWVSGRDHHLSAYASCTRYGDRHDSDAYAGSWGLDKADLSVTAHVGSTRNSHSVQGVSGTSITRHARGSSNHYATASSNVSGTRTLTNPQGDRVTVRRWFGRQAQLAPAPN